MKPTQEQIVALVRRLRAIDQYSVEDCFVQSALYETAADMLEQLAADLLTVCKREAAMIERYDAKLDALERAKPAGVLKGIDPQVISAARDLGEQEKQNPEWAFIDYEANQMLFGRWAKCGTNPAPYVRLDIVLAALEPAPDAPVTVSTTEQDLGSLVEHFKAKAEKAYADGVRDAAEVCTRIIKDYDVLKPDGKTYEPMRIQKAAKGMVSLAREDIRALLTEKPHD